ncbi:hypothetical protein D1164_00950 [Mariniphaga sediminis]|uniref:LamG domain-containing protein n=1 Tax=Mariniphaga sediminis TaxID=1628158 RepID=A0A399D9T0_9BACT|nr:hypothetical protein [Mariniphaga sediminis]RIH67032.1 hypothetical protein D1164_00950 [Mariniphaga sediminis]
MNKKMTLALLLILGATTIFAQANYRPGLFFREDWKEIPAEIPLSQKHVNNPDLMVQLYGAGKDSLKKSNHERPADDPYYVWSGLCLGNWLVSLKHKQNNVDLTGFAKIRWRTKQAGVRSLHIALKLADGTWLVSNLSDGPSKDWRIKEFNIQDIKWHRLDIERVTETGPLEKPDLSNVEEIGFTDLMPGGKSAACSRLDWIEVDGKPVKR